MGNVLVDSGLLDFGLAGFATKLRRGNVRRVAWKGAGLLFSSRLVAVHAACELVTSVQSNAMRVFLCVCRQRGMPSLASPKR